MSQQAEEYQLKSIIEVRPLEDVPDSIVRQVELEKGYSPMTPYVLIDWEGNWRKSWEPLSNILDKRMRKQWEDRFRKESKNRKMVFSHVELPILRKRKRLQNLPTAEVVQETREPEMIAEETFRTPNGSFVKSRIVKLKRHKNSPSQASVLIEEEFENGKKNQCELSVATLIAHHWDKILVGAFIDKMK